MFNHKSIVGKLWMTIIGLVAVVLITLGFFLFQYIESTFSHTQDTQAYVKKLFVVVALIGFSMTTFFAFFLSTKISKPILELKKAVSLISRGEYGTRVPDNYPDEIGELGKAFNQMGEELSETIKALNHEKEHLASVLRSMADAVVTFNAEGEIILTNPEGEKLMEEWNKLELEQEWPETSAESSTAISGRSGSSSNHQRIMPLPMRTVFEEVIKKPGEVATKLHVQNGVWDVVMAPLYSRDAVRGVVAVLRNVTEEFRLDKLRKDFLANVSHELRTPLSMLQGYSEALLDDIAASPEERKELVQVIHDESLRMGRLVRDLLDLAKMESGNLEMDFHSVDLGAVVHRVHRKFSVLAKEQNIAFHCQVPDKLRICEADEDRMEQVFTNLLDNALRHTPEHKSINLTVAEVDWKGAPAVQIDISDEGTGIHAEDLTYIFERFYKADKARTRGVTGGTGLGLSIVKNIIDAHKGTIQVKSQMGQGTTFTMTIPCCHSVQ